MPYLIFLGGVKSKVKGHTVATKVDLCHPYVPVGDKDSTGLGQFRVIGLLERTCERDVLHFTGYQVHTDQVYM